LYTFDHFFPEITYANYQALCPTLSPNTKIQNKNVLRSLNPPLPKSNHQFFGNNALLGKNVFFPLSKTLAKLV